MGDRVYIVHMEFDTTEITEEDRYRFLNGECSALATAIAHKTGWGLCLVEWEPGAGHVMAVRPDGMLVDVTGVWAPEEMTDQGELRYLDDVELNMEGWQFLYDPDWREGPPHWIPDIYERAERVAEIVIAEATR